MKKLWDKPSKTSSRMGLIVDVLILIAAITVLYIMSRPTKTIEVSDVSTIVESPIVIVDESIQSTVTETLPEVAPIIEPTPTPVVVAVAEPKPVQQTPAKKEAPVSRGGVPTKPPNNQRDAINKYVREISAKYNMDPYLIMSIIVSESDYNPKCTTGKCLGLMQISTQWHQDRAKRLGVKDFYDPYGNILMGVDYISELFAEYKDPRLVLMMYNMSHKNAMNLYKQGKISKYAQIVIARADTFRKGE